MNRVDELRRIRSKIELLREEEKELSVPLVMNMGMIRNLYDVYILSLKMQDPTADPLDTINRKKFIYAILYIFSPSTLVGEVMRHKLRECVSSVLGFTPTGVSRDYKTGLFFYSTYKEFRESIDIITNDMLFTLGKTEFV